MNELKKLRAEIKKEANSERAKNLSWFFKTGKGQYGEGDVFAGLSTPQSREIVKHFRNLKFSEIDNLLQSRIHEERGIALGILRNQFQKVSDPKIQKDYVDFYLMHTSRINNWDLVDTSAEAILGRYLWQNQKSITLLRKLAKSQSLWERRIAVIATFTFLKEKQSAPSIEIAKLLLSDKEDLIHKALGWMLREMEKHCGKEVLLDFIREQYQAMPRTTLRYAIEHFSPETRQKLLHGDL